MESSSSTAATIALRIPVPHSSPMALQSQSLLRSAILSLEKVYLSRNPTAKSIIEAVSSLEGSPVCYDHFTFRTLAMVMGLIHCDFLDFGYTHRDELRFPAKKLKVLWFAPPETEYSSACSSPLPRIVVAELLVDELSSQRQEIIRKYVKMSGNKNKYAVLASTLGCLTWEKPTFADYQHISRESEYAAWTLVNGYAVNHVTISVHRLKSHIGSMESLTQFIHDQGYILNSEGGTLKVSPDGLLLQSSTVADSTLFTFADGVTESVPCSYFEFAERRILHQYKKLADEEIKEFHRRDGFELGSANGIMESTSMDQVSRRTA